MNEFQHERITLFLASRRPERGRGLGDLAAGSSPAAVTIMGSMDFGPLPREQHPVKNFRDGRESCVK